MNVFLQEIERKLTEMHLFWASFLATKKHKNLTTDCTDFTDFFGHEKAQKT